MDYPKTLRRIEQNDTGLKDLPIGYSSIFYGRFASSDASDYSRLGAAIGNNNHLTSLNVALDDEDPLDAANNEFFNGLKRNSSISDLTLYCRNQTLAGGMEHEILKSYQKINNLTRLYINRAVLDNGGCNVITETLRWCRNLKTIKLSYNSITDEQLLPIVEAIKGGCKTSLEDLALFGNRIGNAGCHALATLLEDPHCSLHTLGLEMNQIGNEGATAIADSLANNTKLKKLYLRGNPFDPSAVVIFCTVLCNTLSVNDTHRSNHTLEELMLSDEQQGQHADHLSSIMIRNWGENKSHVAIKKILKYHPNIDMEPLFEWDADGEQTLKAFEETLRRIERNDAQFRYLRIGYSNFDGWFISSDASDYSQLGAAIGNNTNLKELVVPLYDEDALDAANNEFFNGLKRNSSISDLELNCNQQNLVRGVGHEILKSYQNINNNLTCLCIQFAVLDNGGGNAIIETLRWCRHLKIINLAQNNITDEQLLPIVDTIKGGCNTSLERLCLYSNRIGNAGCNALATLLEDPHCSLQSLDLDSNQIGNEGATAIANSLANNTKLESLVLGGNPFDPSVAAGAFCKLLCNTSSVNASYISNHILENVTLSHQQHAEEKLDTLLEMNEEKNKSHVAIRKILKYHPNIDMKPLFEWDSEGEQTLKALPYVIDWFKRAREAVAGDDEGDYNIEERKLSAIFKFAKAMPLLSVPASHGNGNDKKRKREVVQEA